MAEYKWPDPEHRVHIGKPFTRIDGAEKASGRAKYTYDYNPSGLLYGKILRSPHAHAKVVKIDTSAAEKMPGVKAVRIIQGPGSEIFWAGDEIAAVAAVDEPTAEDAIQAIRVEYEVLTHYVNDRDPGGAGANAKPAAEEVKGTPGEAFAQTDTVIEEEYGANVITHCCLESHGAVCEWKGDQLIVHVSTQNVSGIAGQMAEPLQIPAGNIRVIQDHIGGGFGSKFGPDRWGIEAARLSKDAGGAPVKIMLERDAELMVAGARPSIYARVKLGAKSDGTILAWDSKSWGTGGIGGGGQPPLPYVFGFPNQQKQHTGIVNNIGSARAWRAPNHPQCAVITMCAIDDLAAKLNMDPFDVFMKNIDLTGPRAAIYKEELQIGAEMIGWKKNWHPRGDKSKGPIKRGLGLSLHTWGGRGHNSDCDITIHPDGSVDVKLGSQDLGTGTRTVINMVVADTFAIPMNAVKVWIGDNSYPASGGSGGSTTVGGVSSSTRRGALDALDQFFAKVAPTWGVQPADLEAAGGSIRVKSDPSKSMTWVQACRKLGTMPLTVRGKNPGPGDLTNSGVGGIQMADVSVDVETGIVKMNKLVCVQDCGLIINPRLAESQCYGAMIMGVTYALYEEKLMDQVTGRMLNPNMEFYKLAGIGDIGELVVHLMRTPDHEKRGVIGLGEPPVISPGAAISNAVANAIGVRVKHIPLTPERVLQALAEGGAA